MFHNIQYSDHGRLVRWHKWRASDVGEAKEGLEYELCRRWSNGRVGEWAVTQVKWRKGWRKSCHSIYATAHSPTLPSLYLRHNSFSSLSVASPTSQLILQSFFRFSYVTVSSLTSTGEPPMIPTDITLPWNLVADIGTI